MSRSSKSGLSPSSSTSVDMGRKAEPSNTSGGIGITREVGNIGGVSVSAGANIDITPIEPI